MSTVTTRKTVEDYAAELRLIAAGDDSYEGFLHVEVCAMDKVQFAADPQGDADSDRLAEIRNIIAALRLVRRERKARRDAAKAAAAVGR
ncbi:hypothetical protein [Paractinoplanes atraurantiacus]|uniref:Uncharacterized protein n=1 Tax=Paractinoplanes atraurantiacus TaxID=1036182 RepID=A0A285GZX7_9ACTN|nr:hypothetical protein [Actinoplanes atraurantiacus]SNY29190.1 hypothetical protein SAMN05421748_103206 [Actinoplanes atraurantiacus]